MNKKPRMYTVRISRTETIAIDFEVAAKSKYEAMQAALDQAYNVNFNHRGASCEPEYKAEIIDD